MPTAEVSNARETNPFYEQERVDMPEKLGGILTPNVFRIGGGDDTFSIKGGGIIRRTEISSSTVSGFDNGEQILNQVKIANDTNKKLLATVERAIYVDSKANANLLPGGSSIDESDFQVIGDYNAVIDSDGTEIEEYEVANQMYIRNISAGTVTLYIDVYVRYILNIGNSFSSAQATG